MQLLNMDLLVYKITNNVFSNVATNYKLLAVSIQCSTILQFILLFTCKALVSIYRMKITQCKLECIYVTIFTLSQFHLIIFCIYFNRIISNAFPQQFKLLNSIWIFVWEQHFRNKRVTCEQVLGFSYNTFILLCTKMKMDSLYQRVPVGVFCSQALGHHVCRILAGKVDWKFCF